MAEVRLGLEMEYEVGTLGTQLRYHLTCSQFFLCERISDFEDTYIPKVGTYLASELFLSYSLMQ